MIAGAPHPAERADHTHTTNPRKGDDKDDE